MPLYDIRNDVGIKPIRADLVNVYFFRSPARREVSRRKDPVAELVIMLGGTYKARLVKGDGRWVEAEADEVVYWPAGMERIEENAIANPTECVALFFHWTDPPPDLPLKVRDSSRVIRLLALRLLVLKEDPKKLPAPVWNGFLSAILAEYMRLSMRHDDPLVDQVASYVEYHLSEPFSLQDLAKSVGLNRHYLGRAFKARTGMTPIDYVRRKRVDHALGMLSSDPSFSLKTVARRVGLRDDIQLRRLLQRYTGMGIRTLKKLATDHRRQPYDWGTH